MSRFYLFVLMAAAAFADTVTLSDNRMIHGKLTYKDGKFSLLARWGKDTEKPISLEAKDLKSVRFNKTTYNPEPPGAELVARAAKAGGAKAPANPKCEVHGAKKVTGELQAIDEQNVKVNGTNVSRGDVMVLQLK